MPCYHPGKTRFQEPNSKNPSFLVIEIWLLGFRIQHYSADYGSMLELMQDNPGDLKSSRLDGRCGIVFDECEPVCGTWDNASIDCAWLSSFAAART
jgi:hypothetical protein